EVVIIDVAYGDREPGVAKVLRHGSAKVAVADDADGCAFEGMRVGVFLAVERCRGSCHVRSSLSCRKQVVLSVSCQWADTAARSDCFSEVVVRSTAVGSYPQWAMQLSQRGSRPRP